MQFDPSRSYVHLSASGAAVFHLELPTEVLTVPLQGRGAIRVPRGVWHTAKVSAPSRMLVVTHGRGTEHRPVAPVSNRGERAT